MSLPGLTLLAMYLVGMVVATLVALVLKRTILRGPTPRSTWCSWMLSARSILAGGHT